MDRRLLVYALVVSMPTSDSTLAELLDELVASVRGLQGVYRFGTSGTLPRG